MCQCKTAGGMQIRPGSGRILRTAFVALIAALSVTLITACGGSDERMRGGEMLKLHLDVYYDCFSFAPVPVELGVLTSDENECSGTVNWGDSDEWFPIQIHWCDWGLACGSSGHTYEEEGEYTITLRAFRSGRPSINSILVRIGPVIRPFTDPKTGDTYDIIDGLAIVTFADAEHFSQLEGRLWDDLEIRDFLLAESLGVRDVWEDTASAVFILPTGTTVEEAVNEWPQRYPDLISEVYPSVVSEQH